MAFGQGGGAAHNSYSAASFVISGVAAKYILCGASKSCAPHLPLGRSPLPLSHLARRALPFSHYNSNRLFTCKLELAQSSVKKRQVFTCRFFYAPNIFCSISSFAFLTKESMSSSNGYRITQPGERMTFRPPVSFRVS